jgi:SEC-C motif domain protein
VSVRADQPCPCGSGEVFGRCCLPLHTDERRAQTAEQLMRSRYSAYAVGNLDYVWRTWHPRTRPASLSAVPGLQWVGLEIVDTDAGAAGDDAGVVTYRAHYREGRRSGTLHERSRFAVRARRWFYVDGDMVE